MNGFRGQFLGSRRFEKSGHGLYCFDRIRPRNRQFIYGTSETPFAAE